MASTLFRDFGNPMHKPVQTASLPILMHRAAFDDAMELTGLYGDDAGVAAADLAEAAINTGNRQAFCHWRQIERMLVCLSIQRCYATLH